MPDGSGGAGLRRLHDFLELLQPHRVLVHRRLGRRTRVVRSTHLATLAVLSPLSRRGAHAARARRGHVRQVLQVGHLGADLAHSLALERHALEAVGLVEHRVTTPAH